MTTTATKNCKKCGAAFTASANDYTVNCPAHRGRAASAAKVIASTTVTCTCGKTVYTDGFGHATGNTCPRGCDG